MGYGIVAEASKPVDWEALQKAVASIRRRVEYFPVTKEAGGKEGLGLSVAQIKLSDEAWVEVVEVAELVQKQFGMDVYDMATGLKFGPDTLEKLQKNFLPEE